MGWEAEPGGYYWVPLRKCTEPRRTIRAGTVEKLKSRQGPRLKNWISPDWGLSVREPWEAENKIGTHPP